MSFGITPKNSLYEANIGEPVHIQGKMKNDATGIIKSVEDNILYLNPHVVTHPSGFGYVESRTDHTIALENIFGKKKLSDNDYKQLLKEHPVLSHINNYVSISTGALSRLGRLTDIVSGYATLNPSIVFIGQKCFESKQDAHFPLSNAEILRISDEQYESLRNNNQD